MAGLAGKVALLTAATDGIGFAIAKRILQENCNVMVSSRKPENVKKAVAELEQIAQNYKCEVFGVPCNAGSDKDQEELVHETTKKFGKIDLLVSCAGTNPVFGNLLDVSDETWDKIMQVNVKAGFQLAKRVVPIMRNAGGGSIVYVSSIAAYQPLRYLGAYSVSKTALLGLTKALACEVASDHIRVNCIAPGVIDTRFAAALTRNEEVSKNILSSINLGRFGAPSDVAGLACFLLSDDASYITGESFVVAGGSPSRL